MQTLLEKEVMCCMWNDKGQTSTSDFTLSLIVFLVALGIAMSLLVSNNIDRGFEDQQRQLSHATSLLMKSGIPADWDTSTVVSPGIHTDGRVNVTKLRYFDELDYGSKRGLLQLSADFVFFFEDSSGVVNVSDTCYFGHDLPDPCSLDLELFEFDDLAISERITILDGEIVKMVAYSWD